LTDGNGVQKRTDMFGAGVYDPGASTMNTL